MSSVLIFESEAKTDFILFFTIRIVSKIEIAISKSIFILRYMNKNWVVVVKFRFKFAINMRITSTGNVGIGTSNPEVKLDIYGTGTTQHRIQSSSGGDIRFSVDSVGRLGTYSNSDFLLLSNSTERMRITSAGNVGIGTTSPIFRLQVDRNGTGTIASFSNQNDADLNINLTSGVSLITPNTGTLAFGTSSTERMRITSAGNVGIGTTSPTLAKFVLNSGTSNQNALINGDKIGFTRTSDSAEVVYFKKDTSLGAEGTANINGYDGIQFRTQGAESVKAVITSAGNVGIGTTTADYRTQIETTSANVLLVKNTSSTSFNRSYFHNNNNIGTQFLNFGSAYGFGTEFSVGQNGSVLQSNTTSAFAIGTSTSTPLYLGTNATERMRITSSGNVYIGKTSGSSKFGISGLPTSSAGLSSGDIWNDGGTLKIV